MFHNQFVIEFVSKRETLKSGSNTYPLQFRASPNGDVVNLSINDCPGSRDSKSIKGVFSRDDLQNLRAFTSLAIAMIGDE